MLGILTLLLTILPARLGPQPARRHVGAARAPLPPVGPARRGEDPGDGAGVRRGHAPLLPMGPPRRRAGPHPRARPARGPPAPRSTLRCRPGPLSDCV